jgi:type IV pilus assembly protein PilE
MRTTTQQVMTVKPEAMGHATRMISFRSRPTDPARRHTGFSLIELMIVVAIAIPSYQNQVRKSRRASAKTALLDVAGREERFYATNNYYPASLSSVGYTVDGTGAVQVPNNTNEDYYGVTLTLNTPPATGYTATAAPVGDQTKDSCGTYSVTDLGVQSATGINNGGLGCW